MKNIHAVFLAVLAASAFAGAKVLDTLVIKGLSVQQPSLVRNGIGLREHADFTAQDVQSAVKSLYRLGYFKTVDFYVTNETDSSASLELDLSEYPMAEAVELVGNKKMAKKDIEEKMTMKKGAVCSDALLFENRTIIKKLYEQKGFLLADVKAETMPTKIPGNVLVKFKINDGPKVLIKKIYFKGNTAFKESKLKWTFKTKERQFFWGGDFEEEQYKNNLDSLILWYNDQGYMDARVVRDSTWYGPNQKDLYLLIDLSEGKRFVTGDFYFTGNKVIETSTLTNTVLMKKGKPFQKSKFDATKEFVVNSYREEGYLWVQVRDKQSFRGDTVDVTFDITEGKPAIVRKIDITGNLKTKEKVIRRELAIMPGQKYKQSLMMRSVREVYQLNFFSNVKPDLHPNDDGTVDLEFNITEKDNIGQLSLGASYSQVDGLMGTFTTSIPNFRGEGQRLDLSLDYGQYRKDVSVGFMEPWAFNTPTALNGSIFANWISYQGYQYNDQTQYGFSGWASRKLKWPDDYFSGTLGYYFAWKQETDTQSTLYSNGVHLTPRGFQSKVWFSLVRSDIDMPMFPNQGSRLEITPEISGIGGDYRFLKTSLSYDWYFPLFWKFVLCAKSKFGLINSIDGSGQVHISRYDAFAGGGSWITDGIIRGYKDRSFGGVYYPENGIALLTLSGEIRFPILEQTLYLSLFGDAGNTWSSLEQVSLTDLYPGVGLGLKIDIPMLGLLGFDFGWGLREPDHYQHFGNKIHGFEFGFQLGKGF
jgi:outer membrane protein insertion porin family